MAKKESLVPNWNTLLENLPLPELHLSRTITKREFLKIITTGLQPLGLITKKVATILPGLIGYKHGIILEGPLSDEKVIASTIKFRSEKLRRQNLQILISNFKKAYSHFEQRTLRYPLTSRPDLSSGVILHVKDSNKLLTVFLLGPRPLDAANIEFCLIVRNILELRLRKSNLNESLAREAESLKLLTHHLSEGMAVLNSNLKITIWNRPMQRLTGFSPKEVVGKHYRTGLHRPDQPEWLEETINAYQGTPLRSIFNEEMQIVARQGEVRWVNISGSFLRRSDNSIDQVILIARDISRLKALEHRKNEFISIATHELRTPITAIKGYLSLLTRQNNNFTDQQQLYLNRAIEANNRLVVLAEDLLRVVQVEEDRLVLYLQPLSLPPLVEKICHDFDSKAQAKNIRIKFSRPATSPLVIADPDKTIQIFANVLDNAIKYTLQGTISIQFRTVEYRQQKYYRTEITDSGIGIRCHIWVLS